MTSKPRGGDTSMELLTTGMASGGDAIAHDAGGKVVFVRGALPAERVRVRLVADRARHAIGSIDEVVEPSPYRVTPPCPEVDRGCGACQWQYVPNPMQQQQKLQFIVESLERSGLTCPDPNPSVVGPVGVSHDDQGCCLRWKSWLPPHAIASGDSG